MFDIFLFASLFLVLSFSMHSVMQGLIHIIDWYDTYRVVFGRIEESCEQTQISNDTLTSSQRGVHAQRDPITVKVDDSFVCLGFVRRARECRPVG